MPTRRYRLLRGLAVVVAALALGAAILWRLAGPGTLFVKRFEAGDAAPPPPCAVAAETARLADGRAIPIRTYAPTGGHERAVLVIHGVHKDGYDEPRLVYFARRLAEAGYAVITPELAALKRYEIDARTVDDVAALARFAAAHPLARAARRDGRIGLVGISFGGGLSVSAAGRPDVGRELAFVLSFGGHGDLARTMGFLARGEAVPGGRRAPHPYGQAVELRLFADRLVPAADAAPLRDALLAYLEGRGEDAAAIAERLGPEARRLVRLALDGEAEALGRILEPLLAGYAPEPALSPERQPAPPCPIYLLHGADDNVIPASETTALAAVFAERAAVHALVTDLIQHVELKVGAGSPPLSSYWRLARFWTALLAE